MAVIFPPKDMPAEKAPDMLATYLEGLLLGFPNAIGIIHRPESNPIEEQDKVHHIHIIVYGDVINKDDWIASIVSLIHCEPIQVSVEAITNDTGALRYLVHADDKPKIQYDPSEVHYKNRSVLAEFKKALAARPDVTIDEILSCKSCEAVARLVGFKNYANAIRLYRDVQDERLEQRRLDAEIAEFYHRQEKATELLKEFLDEYKFLNLDQIKKLQRIQRILTLGTFDDEKN